MLNHTEQYKRENNTPPSPHKLKQQKFIYLMYMYRYSELPIKIIPTESSPSLHHNFLFNFFWRGEVGGQKVIFVFMSQFIISLWCVSCFIVYLKTIFMISWFWKSIYKIFKKHWLTYMYLPTLKNATQWYIKKINIYL